MRTSSSDSSLDSPMPLHPGACVRLRPQLGAVVTTAKGPAWHGAKGAMAQILGDVREAGVDQCTSAEVVGRRCLSVPVLDVDVDVVQPFVTCRVHLDLLHYRLVAEVWHTALSDPAVCTPIAAAQRCLPRGRWPCAFDNRVRDLPRDPEQLWATGPCTRSTPDWPSTGGSTCSQAFAYAPPPPPSCGYRGRGSSPTCRSAH